MKLEKVLH